jgi:hypothetical protein
MIPSVRVALTPSPRVLILKRASAETRAWVLAVEAADGARLENAVLSAMIDFANWRIPFGGHCCVMAGARTLNGALVPMIGTAPTGINLVSGDYNRINGIDMPDTKYIQSNVNGNSLAQDSRHAYTYVTVSNFVNTGTFRILIGTSTNLLGGMTGISVNAATNLRVNASSSQSAIGLVTTAGGYGVNRNSSALFTSRAVSTTGSSGLVSISPGSGNFRVSDTAGFQGVFSLYSIGPDIGNSLTELNNRTVTLMAAIAAGVGT